MLMLYFSILLIQICSRSWVNGWIQIQTRSVSVIQLTDKFGCNIIHRSQIWLHNTGTELTYIGF